MHADLEITTPNGATFNLKDRLMEVAREHSNLSQITPELVLGLTPTQIRALRSTDGQITRAHSQNTNVFVQASARWQSANRAAWSAPSAYLLTQSSGQTAMMRRIATGISEVAIDKTKTIIFEEGTSALVSFEEENVIHFLTTAPHEYSGTIRGLPVRAGRNTVVQQNNNKDIFVDDIFVGAVGDIRGQVHLAVHPFVSAGEFTGATMEGRKQLLGQIVDASIAAISAVHGEVEAANNTSDVVVDEAEQHRRLSEAVALLDMVPAFTTALSSSNQQTREQTLQREISNTAHQIIRAEENIINSLARAQSARQDTAALQAIGTGTALLERYNTSIEEHVQRATQQRQEIVNMQRRRRELEIELQQHISNGDSVSVQRVANALMECFYIRQLGAVRSITVTQQNRSPGLRIKLHPFVMESSRHRVLLDKLDFFMPLSGEATYLTWTNVTQNHRSPHPHVSSGGSTCWGAADTHLRAALRNLEFSTVVTLICGWARLYNGSSPYERIDRFPATRLSPGWHPELPMGI